MWPKFEVLGYVMLFLDITMNLFFLSVKMENIFLTDFRYSLFL